MWEPSVLSQRSASILSGLLTEVKIIPGKIRKPEEEPAATNGASGKRSERSRGTAHSLERETTEYDVDRFFQNKLLLFPSKVA